MSLTKKELEVLELKKKGFTQIQIAKKLNISQPAVSSFYRNAMLKIKDSYETVKLAKKLRIKDE
ncbi:MAG: LuxR C-terminal-related transcriptional regulator [archaeon]